jgi:integrase
MAQIIKRTTQAREFRYDVRTRIGGRVVTQTFKRRRDADNYATEIEGNKLHGTAIDPRRARRTFATVAATWLAAGTTKRSSSIARDKSIIDTHLKPALGERAIGSITRADVQSAVDAWSAKQSPSTVGRQYSCLRAIFAYAEAAEIIMRSPCRNTRLPRVRLVDRPYLTPKQLSELAEKLGIESGAFMWCGAVLGLRWSEVAGITVSRLDILNRSLIVDQQLSRSGKLVPPKSGAGTRTLACPTWLIDTFAAVLAKRKLTAADPDALLFVNSNGSPLAYSNWRRRKWVPACDATGLEGLRFHDLRSMAASALVAAGVDVKTAQTRLGHSSPQVTLGIYARATKEADRLAADAIGDIFQPQQVRLTALDS